MGWSELGLKFDAAGVAAHGIVKPARVPQHITQIVVHLSVVGCQGQRPAVAGLRITSKLQVFLGTPQSDQSVSEVRFQVNCEGVRRERLLVPPGLHQGVAQVEMPSGIVWIVFQGRRVGFQRARDITGEQQQIASVEVGPWHGRRLADCGVVALHGLLKLSVTFERVAF